MTTTDPKVLQWLEEIPTWPARLLESRAEMDGVRRLMLDVTDHPLRSTYTTPGQFVALGAGGDRRFFAVASDPRPSGAAEFLVGAGQAVADALLDLEPGATVDLSAALGDGYPVHVDEAYGVVGSGTGMASLRPAVDALIAAHRRVRVWVGGRPDGAFPFADALDGWTAQGVAVRRTTGHVSELVEADLDALRTENDVAGTPSGWRWLVCGSDVMQQATLRALVDAGVPRQQVHFNW